MKILIVDDSRAMRNIVRRALRQAGFEAHEVAEAENGSDALNAIKAAPPGLVLSDWNMPTMNGYELLQALKAGGSMPKFGFVTSEATPEMRAKAADAGAAFLLTKPFTHEDLARVLRPILG